MPLLRWYYVASVIWEALLGGGTCSLFPWSKLDWSPVLSKFVFLCSLIPNIVFVALKIWPLFLCSPEINALYPCSPKPLRRPHTHLTDRLGPWAQQSIIHIEWLQSSQIEKSWIYGSSVHLNKKKGTPKWLGPVAQSIVSSIAGTGIVSSIRSNIFEEIDHDIFSIVILLLQVIQEVILSVTFVCLIDSLRPLINLSVMRDGSSWV